MSFLFLLLLLLPFLSLLPHPTVWLFLLIVLILTDWGIDLFRSKCQYPPLFILVFLFGLSYLIGGIGAGFFAGAVSCMCIWLCLPASRLFASGEQLQKGKRYLVLSSGIVARIGVLQYVLGKAELNWVDTSRFGDIGGRVTSTFSNPNILAVYLLLAFPFAMEGILDKASGKKYRVMCTLSLLYSAGCLVLTWSRGAWLGALASISLFCIVYSRKSRRLLLYATPLALLAVPLLPHNIINRFSSIGNLSESSIRYRLYVWKGVCRMICRYPCGIGVGENAFSETYLSYAVSGTEGVIHSHQIVLQIMCDTGIWGLLLFLAVLVLWSKKLYRGSREFKPRAVAFCAVCGCLVMGFFDHIWYHYGNMALFWTVAGMLCESERSDRIK